MKSLGDFDPSAIIYGKFTTYRPSTGAPFTLAGTPALSVYKDNSTTQSTTGVTLTVDFDSVTGLHHFAIDTSADGTFYAAGSFFDIVITTGTVDSVSAVGTVVSSFTLRKTTPVKPTTAGRTLDVSAGGEAGVDWANVGSPTTTLALTGTTIATTQMVDVNTIKTNAVVNGGTITFPSNATLASTTNITAGTITTVTTTTTATNLTNAPTNGDFTATMKTSIGTAVAASAVSSVTGNVGGNVVGTVASVVGNVGGNVTGTVASVVGNVGGNVTGSVGSVVGAVGSVTGNVGGNVTGSVASVLGNVAGTVASVVGNVGGNVVGSVGSVVAGVTVSGTVTLAGTQTFNNTGSWTGNITGNLSGSVGSVTGNLGGNIVGTVSSVVGAVGSVTGNVGGNVTGSVGSVLAGVTVSGNVTVGTNLDKANYTLVVTPPTAIENATAWFATDLGDGRTGAYYVKGGFNKTLDGVPSAGFLTVFDTDDSTPLCVAATTAGTGTTGGLTPT